MLTTQQLFIHESTQGVFLSALDHVPGVLAIPLSVPTLKPGREYLVTATAQDLFQLGVYYGYGILLTLTTTGE